MSDVVHFEALMTSAAWSDGFLWELLQPCLVSGCTLISEPSNMPG